MSATFEAKYADAAGGKPGNEPEAVARRASLLTRNRAFDGYKISDRRSRGSSALKQILQPPDITLRRVMFIGLWVAVQAIVLISKWVSVGREAGALKGFGVASMSCLMVSLSAIFLFMSPAMLELLRRTLVSRYVVIEKNVHAHKIAAYTMTFWTICHIIYYYYIFHKGAAASKGETTFSSKLFGTMVGKTGHAMLFLFFFIFVASIPVVRRRFYEVFYWVHHLFVPCVILLFVHGGAESFQWYIIAPGLIYIVDRLYRFGRSRFRRPRILAVIQHPSNVIELKIERRGMKFQVGQYIYLNIPSISLIEWHPFTLTSAPEEDVLSVHIWVAGGWTRKLVELFQQAAVTTLQPDTDSLSQHDKEATNMYMQSMHNGDSKVSGLTEHLENSRDVPEDPTNPGTLKKLADQELLMHHIRGEIDPASGLPKAGVQSQFNNRRPSDASSHRPWSRPGRHSIVLLDRLPPEVDFRISGSYVHATPTAGGPTTARVAAMQPLINLPNIMVDGPYGAPTQQVFDYEHVVLIAGGIGVTPMSSVLKSLYYQLTSNPHQCRIRKVYFLWVCRDVQALEWFQDLLAALDEEDIGNILEVRTYLTGQLPVEQIRNIALYQDPNGPDAVTGLYRSPTYYGRPNFNSIFEDIGLRTPGSDIGVFFCGPKPMGRSLRNISRKWTKNFGYTNTKFVFHKENF
ncbi:hypothetical protein GGF46_003960 [Coemansia sp. RSA 552]|nr:hypothetical protein GGF46_003960 [Coemansia sp. RSA 552]